jgi:hypothetical protein
MKIFYLYDESGVYLGDYVAQINPVNPLEYIAPTLSTDIKPVPTEKTWPVWVGDKWTYAPDYRGTIWNTSTGEPLEHKEIGLLPEGHTDKPKPEGSYKWQSDKWVYDIEQARLIKKSEIKALFDAAINQPVTSSVLGAVHTYTANQEGRSFINNLVTLGAGGKLTCTDSAGVTSRKQHTHAQLLSLGGDIRIAIEKHFDRLELLTNAINAANQSQLNSIAW